MIDNDAYRFFCSVCLTLASDPRSDHTLCDGCDALEREVTRRRECASLRAHIFALTGEVYALRAVIGDAATADILPEAPPEDSCAA